MMCVGRLSNVPVVVSAALPAFYLRAAVTEGGHLQIAVSFSVRALLLLETCPMSSSYLFLSCRQQQTPQDLGTSH